MLRPFSGVRVEVLEDVWAALKASSKLFSAEDVDRGLVASLWSISKLGRLWALDPNGMLQRNALINVRDIDVLADFLDRFDMAVMILLEEGDNPSAFNP